jgi:SAM-dependent methyltransferase
MNDYTHKEFYNRKLSEVNQLNEQLPTDERRAAIIINLVKRWLHSRQNQKIVRIIDVGCGVGWLSQRLLPFGEVIGIDSSNGAIDIARNKFPEVKFSCIDILNDVQTLGLGVFDLAIATEVIEHIPYKLQPVFASKLSLLVRPGGILIATTPNRLVSKYYWKKPESLGWKQPVEDWPSPSELCSLLGNNFECLEISTFDFTFTRDGLYRFLNSYKLNLLARKLHMDGWINNYKIGKYGLYIAAAFRRCP